MCALRALTTLRARAALRALVALRPLTSCPRGCELETAFIGLDRNNLGRLSGVIVRRVGQQEERCHPCANRVFESSVDPVPPIARTPATGAFEVYKSPPLPRLLFKAKLSPAPLMAGHGADLAFAPFRPLKSLGSALALNPLGTNRTPRPYRPILAV